MDQFQRVGVFLIEVDACDAAVEHLTPELTEVGAALVVNPCVGEQARLESRLDDANGEVDVFTETHLREAVELVVDLSTDAHVERAGIELVELFLSAANAACGEERRHGIGNGLLHGSERVGRAVGAAKGVAGLASQLIVDGLQVTLGKHHVGVENKHIVACGALHTIVAALSGTAVLLHEIAQRQLAGVAVTHIAAGRLRSVFHNDDLKVLQLLV